MRRTIRMAILGILLMSSFARHAGAAPKTNFGAEAAENLGQCSLSPKAKGNLWEFKASSGEWVTMCCPIGQYPTGKVGPKDQKCALPAPARCDTGEPVKAVCLTSPPTLQCCKPGQIVLCKQSVTERRCANPEELLPSLPLPKKDV